MQVGTTLGLPNEQMADLFYTLLMTDLGCSSNQISDKPRRPTDAKWISIRAHLAHSEAILATAHVSDALSTDQPYRAAMP